MLLSWMVIFSDGEILETPGEDPDSKQAEQEEKNLNWSLSNKKILNGIVLLIWVPPKKFLHFLIMMRMTFQIFKKTI
ncbi:MAG: hypothetical protein CM1200mP5_4520 [Candidatus Pelagibacterales bacterium]|nr:MAG: hypothetical protein CM1200mP5_4520 [Pelagibacterales bacterium]